MLLWKKKSLQGTNNFNFSKGGKKKFVCRSKLSATGPQPQGLQQVLQIENFTQSEIGKAEKKKERKIWNVWVSAIRSVAGDPA